MHGRAALISAVFLLAPASAQAATYTVNQSTGDDINPCSAASPCKTINAAISKARSVSPPPPANTISVSKGTYTDHLKLDDVRDDGLTIDGVRNIFFGSTFITNTTADTTNVLISEPNVTLRDLVVQTSNTTGTDQGVVVNALDATLLNVAISMTTKDNGGQAILPLNTAQGLVLDRVDVSGDWIGSAVLGQSKSMTVRDSTIQAGHGDNVVGLGLEGSLDVARSRITIPSDVNNGGIGIRVSPSVADAHVTVDSTEILGGQIGVEVDATGGDKTVATLLRHDTFDQGTLGTGQGSPFDSVLANSSGGGTAAVTIANSIGVESPDFTGIGALTCRDDDMGTGTCSTDGGGNSHSDPDALFVDAVNGNYAPRSDSPAIDSGSTDGLAADESATDRLGKPRIVDGNFDCTARRDKGARETQGQSNTAPTASVSGADSALAGSPVGSRAPGATPRTRSWASRGGSPTAEPPPVRAPSTRSRPATSRPR